MMEEWIGRKHTEQWTVTHDRLACSLKSGTVEVFATPFMIALMEYTCLSLVQPGLPEGITTVGTRVDVSHTAPTPEGAAVTAEAELLETDGRRFLFRVTARDEAGVIGEGTHERCSVKIESFQKKAAARLHPEKAGE
jgi:fluoroacetyl-CoA thioesterase